MNASHVLLLLLLTLDTFDNVDYKDVGDDEGVHTASTSLHFHVSRLSKVAVGKLSLLIKSLSELMKLMEPMNSHIKLNVMKRRDASAVSMRKHKCKGWCENSEK